MEIYDFRELLTSFLYIPYSHPPLNCEKLGTSVELETNYSVSLRPLNLLSTDFHSSTPVFISLFSVMPHLTMSTLCYSLVLVDGALVSCSFSCDFHLSSPSKKPGSHKGYYVAPG